MRKSAGKSKRAKVAEEPEISEEENTEENGKGNGVESADVEPNEEDEKSGSESEAEVKSKKKKAGKQKKGKKGRTPKKKAKEVAKDEEDEEYEVEAIVGQRFIRGKRQFKVHWRGHGSEEDSWCGETDLHCEELIREFLDSERGEVGESSGTSKKKGRKRAADDDDDGTDEEEYEVDKILEVKTKKNGDREFLIRWKGYTAADDTWEPEAHLSCKELIKKILAKAEKAKESTDHELRTKPKQTSRLTFKSHQSRSSRRIAKEGGRKTYHDDLE